MRSRILIASFVAACLAVSASVTSEARRQHNVRIDGAAAGDQAGGLVAAAGDVNGDRKPDFLLGGEVGRSAYVLFGQASPSSVDLASLGKRGFRIDAKGVGGIFAIAGAGDVNGDGRGDVVVGVANATVPGNKGSGAAFVVFGSASNTSVSLAALGGHGFRMDGTAGISDIGYSVAATGDVNGDGLADVVVAAEQAGSKVRPAGAAFVVFGRKATTTIDLAALGDAGFRIDGAFKDEEIDSVAGVGDVNGDGRPDVAVGSPGARNGAGFAYVVYGKASPTSVDLAVLGRQGFQIDGSSGQEAGK